MVSPSKAQQQQPQENRSRETDKRSHVRIQKGPRPLEKKTFYLDIKNHALSNKLEAKIKELGGKIELFLVRNISLVVSDRADKSEQTSGDKLKWGWVSGGSGGLPSLRSIEVPRPIPTPPTPSPVTESPLANSTNLRALAPRPKSRADAMLERALTQPQQYSVDPLENAQSWGIPVWATSKLQAWLEKIYASLKERHNLKQQSNVSREPNVKHLKSPYIKFESFRRDTKPVFLELTTWPRLNFESEPGSCPFDTNQREYKESKLVKKDIKENKNNSIHKQLDKDKDMTRRPRGGPTRTRRTEQLVSGYCEICRIDYRDLNTHVSSDQHLNFVRNDDNFLSLDTLINAGASVEAFLNFNRSKQISKDCSLFPNVGHSLRSVVLSEDKVDSIPKSDLNGYRRDNINMVQCNGARRNLNLKLNSSHNLRARAKHESGHLLRSKGSPWHEVEKNDKFYDKFEGCTITKRAKGTIWIEEDDSNDKCINEDSFKDIEGSDFKESATLNNVSSANIEDKDCINTNKSSSGSQSINFKNLNCDIKKVYELNCLQNRDEYHGREKVTDANNRDSNDIIVPVENKIHVPGQELKEEKSHKSNKTVCIKESYSLDSLRPCSRSNKIPVVCEKVHNDSSKCNGHANGSSVKLKSEQCDTKIEQSNSKTSLIVEKSMKDDNFKTNKSSRRGGRTYRGRQRLSVEERLIEDNRAYYKVEVLGNKLRSSIIQTGQTSITVKDTNETRKDDDFKKDDVIASSEKPVVVRFKRVRKSELSLLSNEAETFMFGEPKRDDTTDSRANDESSILPRDTESERDATSESLNLESSVNSEVSVIDEVTEEDSQDSLWLGRARKRRRTQAESLIKDNADYYKFQTPGSRLRYQAPLTGVKESHESTSTKPQMEDISMNIETVEPTYSAKPSPQVEKMQFSFEAIPKSEPWYQTYQRQDEGAEFWHCFSEGDDQKPFLLPYEIENFHETLLRGFGKGDNARKRGRGRGGGGVNRSPRKSPRCHASTLAIMSTLIRKREQLQSPNLSIIEEECNSNTQQTHTPKPETGCIAKPELDEDLKAIVKKIDDMLSGKHFIDLEDSFETELGASVGLNSFHQQLPKGPPPDLLDLLDNCQDINCLDNSSCASSECGEITSIESPLKRRKRRKNRTGWPGIKMRKKLQVKHLVDGEYEGENVPDQQTEGNRISESVDTQIMLSELQISTDNRRMESNSVQEFRIATAEENVDNFMKRIENESPDSHSSIEFCSSSRIESLLTQNKNSIDIDKISSTQSEPSSDSAKSDGSSFKNDASSMKSLSREPSKITKLTDDSVRNLQNCDYSCKTPSQIVAVSRKPQITNSISCKVEQRSMPTSEKQYSCLEDEESNNSCIKDLHTMDSASVKKQINSGFAPKRRQNEEMSSEIHESDPDDENRILPCRKDPQSLMGSKTQRIANNLSKKRHYKEMSSEMHESDPGEENCENSCAKGVIPTLFQKQANSNTVTRKRQREETSSSNVHTSDCEDENSCSKKDANQIISSKKQQSSRKRSRRETISSETRDSDIEFAFSMSQRVSPVVSSVELKNRRSSIEFQPVVRMTKIDDQVDMDNGVLSVTVASNRRLRSSTSPRSNLHPPTKQFRNTRAQFGRWIKNS